MSHSKRPKHAQTIYHLLPVATWEKLSPAIDYRAESLATEGFIHCTGESERLVEVANRFYRQADGAFVILSIDCEMLKADVRWEPADGHLFPHVYGPINRSAIVTVTPFPRQADGQFLPPSLT